MEHHISIFMRSKNIWDITRVSQYCGLYSFSASHDSQIWIESILKEFYTTEEMQEEEELEGAHLVDLVSETVEEPPEQSQWLAQTYQKEAYVEAVILGLTKGATFPVTIAGTNCNALIDTHASWSCISDHFDKQLMLPWVQ